VARKCSQQREILVFLESRGARSLSDMEVEGRALGAWPTGDMTLCTLESEA